MSMKILQRFVAYPGIVGALLMLAGCQGMTMTGLRESAQVRVIQASSDAPPIDFYVGENALAYSLAFGTSTSYVPVNQGSYVLHADVAGSHQTVGLVTSSLQSGHSYTAIVGHTLGSLRLTVLADQTRPALAGDAALRLVDQAVHSGPIDIYLVPSGSPPLASATAPAMVFGAVDGYKNVPAGNYSLTVMPAGSTPGSAPAVLTSPQMTFAPGSVRTIVLLDRPSGVRLGTPQAVQAIVNEEPDASNNN